MVLVIIILVVSSLMNRTRIPLETAFMVAGIIIGPYGFKILPLGGTIQELASFGLIYMLFLAGLEIKVEHFKEIGTRIITFGLFTFLFPFLAGLSIGIYFGLDLLGRVLLGSILSSHTIITYPFLKERGLMKEEVVSVAFFGTVFTDIGANHSSKIRRIPCNRVRSYRDFIYCIRNNCSDRNSQTGQGIL